jgi:amidase
MPTTPTTAPALPPRSAPLGDSVRLTNNMFTNTAGFNATHHPGLSIPCGEHNSLPVGLMLVGRLYDEATVLRIGHAYETR